ncbi:hypothetical protein Zm00014a_036742 [Zea mays]|uniref:Mitochondrial import inner membrane translocase subunit TIM50 n=1 Tax=Zea mays TaxID=4577 RepID=A0A3L6E347_MAIZE|nr:hypothetical protein Zm00014a_036742 [Zea mays]
MGVRAFQLKGDDMWDLTGMVAYNEMLNAGTGSDLEEALVVDSIIARGGEDMSYCTVTGCKTIDNKDKPLVLKELKRVWNKDEPDLPWGQGEFSPSNTLLVDDSPYKALCNPPNTAIFPEPYNYMNQRDDYSLGPGGDLRVYLQRIAAADNVQNFVRDNPFGQKSITESDSNWNFYVKIVDKMEKQIVDQVETKIVDEVERSLG